MTKRTSQASSCTGTKTDLTSFVKSGVAIEVDRVAAAYARGQVFTLRKKCLLGAARTWIKFNKPGQSLNVHRNVEIFVVSN